MPTDFDGARISPKKFWPLSILDEWFVSSKQMQTGSYLSS